MILVDFSPVSMSTGFACANELSEDLLRHLVLNKLLNYKKQFGGTYGDMYIVFDDRNYWRKDIWPGYKGQRKEAREASALDFDLFFKYMDAIKAEFKEVLPYGFLQIERCEADDICGHLGITAKEPTVIVSNDGDFKQCTRNPRTKFYKINTGTFHEDQTLFEVEFDLHTKILKGDGGDNIRSVMSLLTDTERQKPITKKIIEHTFEVGLGETIKDRYEENKKLIDLREIPAEYKLLIEEAVAVPIVKNKGKLYNYITQPKLNRVGSFFSELDFF